MKKATDTTQKNIFAERLGDLIKEENYTHDRVAKAVGVTRQGVGKWISGESVPDVLTAAKLADFFCVSVDYLSGNCDIKYPDSSVKAACEYTTLSEDAILSLGNSFLGEKGMKIFSDIIADESLLDIIEDIKILSELQENEIDIAEHDLYGKRSISTAEIIRYRIIKQMGFIMNRYDYRTREEGLNNGKHNQKNE